MKYVGSNLKCYKYILCSERGEEVKAGKRDKINVRKVRGVRKGRRKERKRVRRINKCLHIYGF